MKRSANRNRGRHRPVLPRLGPPLLVGTLLVLAICFQISISPALRAASGPANVATGISAGYPVGLNDQQKLFYDGVTGIWWAFYSDGSSMLCSTSSSGSNWAPPTTINGSVTIGSKFSVDYDSGSESVYYVSAGGASTFHFRYGHLTSGGCASVEWSTGLGEVAGAHGGLNFPTISVVGAGKFWVSVTENANASSYVEVFLCVGATCVSKLVVTLPAVAYDSEVVAMGTGPGSVQAGVLFAPNQRAGGGPITFDYTDDDGATWNASAFVTANTYSGNRMSAMSVGTTLYAAAIQGVSNSSNSIFFFSYTLGGARPSETSFAPPGTLRNVDIARDNGTGLVIGYTDASNVYFAQSNDLGGAWETPQSLFTGEPVIFQSVLNIAHESGYSFGAMWSEGANNRTIRFGMFDAPPSVSTNSTTASTSTPSNTTTTSTTGSSLSSTSTSESYTSASASSNSTSATTSSEPTTTVATSNSTSTTASSSSTSATTSASTTSSSTTSTSARTDSHGTTTASLTTTVQDTSTGLNSSSTVGKGEGSQAGTDSGLVYFLLSLDMASALVAFPISFFAFRFNRFLKSPGLRAIGVGFALLGSGLLVEGTATLIADATVVDGLLAHSVTADAGLLFLGLQLAAYAALAWGYGMEALSRGKGKALDLADPSSVLPVGILASALGGYYDVALLSYVVMALLLAFVIVEGVLAYGRNRRHSALLVLLAFSFMLLGHLLMLDSVVTLASPTFGVGTVAQFIGFAILLWFLERSGRFGSS